MFFRSWAFVLVTMCMVCAVAQTSSSVDDATLMGYVHVFQGLQMGKESAQLYPARVEAYLGYLGLDDSQGPIVSAKAADFTKRVRSINSELAALSGQTTTVAAARRGAIVDKKRALIREVVAELSRQSPGAALALQKHVSAKVVPGLQVPVSQGGGYSK